MRIVSLIGVGVLAFVVLLSGSVGGNALSSTATETASTTGVYRSVTPKPVCGVESDSASDVGIELTVTALVASSSDVFIGHIENVSRTELLPTSAPDITVEITYYTAVVDRSFKGRANGRIEVRQQGGATNCGFVNGDAPLERGRSYLFYVNQMGDSQTYTIFAPGYGNVYLATDQQRAQLASEIEQVVRAEKTEAVPSSVPS